VVRFGLVGGGEINGREGEKKWLSVVSREGELALCSPTTNATDKMFQRSGRAKHGRMGGKGGGLERSQKARNNGAEFQVGRFEKGIKQICVSEVAEKKLKVLKEKKTWEGGETERGCVGWAKLTERCNG